MIVTKERIQFVKQNLPSDEKYKYIFHKIDKRHVDEKHANEIKFEVDFSVACEGKQVRVRTGVAQHFLTSQIL